MVLTVLPGADERLRHYERLHEEELKEIERLFGDQGPGFEVVARAQASLAELGIAAERKVRHGEPAEEILAEIREGGYGLVVIGGHGELGLPADTLGDVAARVVEASPVPVLVVKEGRDVGNPPARA
jgi:nucleotide-binding universal stress UspA family protein